MTYERKSESTEFRTREAQLSALMGVIAFRQDYPVVAKLLTQHIAEAEARGAAEQRQVENLYPSANVAALEARIKELEDKLAAALQANREQ